MHQEPQSGDTQTYGKVMWKNIMSNTHPHIIKKENEAQINYNFYKEKLPEKNWS